MAPSTEVHLMPRLPATRAPRPVPRSAAPRSAAPRSAAGGLRAAALAASLALLPAAGLAQGADTLFADLGGHDGVSRIVDAAAATWLADDRIKDTFADANVPRLRRLLYDQICHITGGGCDYRGQDMARAHRGLHLHTAQFNALAEDLQTAMDRLGIASSTQNRLVALLAPMHRDIVTR
ncbi:MAG: group I truncated hemoglobin [Janthinobacterium lividum]